VRLKIKYVRDKRLLQMAGTLHCQNCGKNDSTVCAAHSNWAEHGKGRGIKASDIYIASLCHDCHMELDQGKTLSKDERKEMWTKAHIKTMDKLVQLGYVYPSGLD